PPRPPPNPALFPYTTLFRSGGGGHRARSSGASRPPDVCRRGRRLLWRRGCGRIERFRPRRRAELSPSECWRHPCHSRARRRTHLPGASAVARRVCSAPTEQARRGGSAAHRLGRGHSRGCTARGRERIATRTLVSTVSSVPNPLVAALSAKKERGRIV